MNARQQVQKYNVLPCIQTSKMLLYSTDQPVLPYVQMSKMLLYLTDQPGISTSILLAAQAAFLNAYG
jgi:hypothetical protein